MLKHSTLFITLCVLSLIYGSSVYADASVFPENAFFDGKQTTVLVPNSRNMNFSAITAQAFVSVNEFKSEKVGANSNYQFILFKKSTQSSHNEGFALYLDESNGKFVAAVASADKIQVWASTSENFVEAGKWYQIAMTADNKMLKLYINGDLAAQAETGFNLDFDTKPIYIGGRETPEYDKPVFDGKFNGYIDQVKIWSVSKYPDEISGISYLENNLTDPSLCAYLSSDKVKIASSYCIPDEGVFAQSSNNELAVYPNPVSDEFSMQFNLDKSSFVNAKIYDQTGRCISELYKGYLSAGQNNLNLNIGTELSSGIYIVKLFGSDFVKTATLVKGK